jgi:uncharacterized protein (TIGR02996 family)
LNELLQAIAERPLDDALRLVYADWLLERGDPLGELIQREHRGEPTAARYAELAPRLLGELHGHVLCPSWRLGFLHGAVDRGTGPVHSPVWRTVCSLDTDRAELVAQMAHPGLQVSTGWEVFLQLLVGPPLPLRWLWPVQLDPSPAALPRRAQGLPQLAHLALIQPPQGREPYELLDWLLSLPLPLEGVRLETHRPPDPAQLRRWAAHPTLQRVEWRDSGWAREGEPLLATLPALPSALARARARQDSQHDDELEEQGDPGGPWPWAAATARGPVRQHNEDTFGTHPSGLWVVVDGMGGQGFGAYAGELARRVLVEPGAAAERFAEASRALAAVGTGLGAAAARLRLADGQAEVAWAGDVRAYLLTEGRLVRLTEDHTLVAQMVRQGRLQPWEAADHPNANILVQAIFGEGGPPSERSVPARPGDRLLLVSDGVWGALDDPTMHALILASPTLADAVCALVSEAGRCSGTDNATALLVAIP